MEEPFLEEEFSFAKRLRWLEQAVKEPCPQGGGTVVATVTITLG